MEDSTHDAECDATTYTTQVDWNSRPPSNAVVSLVADAEGVEPIDLEPLHSTIDPGALDRLFAPTNTETDRTSGHVAFAFEGYHVTIHGDGEITAKAVLCESK
jgi:hypothetical protein